MKRILMTVMLAFLAIAAASAQEQPAETPKPQPQAAPKPVESGQGVNVSIELTITDQGTAAAPTVRGVTLLVADAATGRIRTMTTSGPPGMLNVDAHPRVLQNDRIQMSLTVEYRPSVSGTAEIAPMSQSLTVILQDGKPLIVSQAADPVSERKVRLEVKATVLR